MAYVRRSFRGHFHALRVLKGAGGTAGLPAIDGQPVVFYTNHPGWWDPLIFLLVAERAFPDRLNYGPIDARALGRYRFLERIGFLGIDPHSRQGAARFLRLARAAGRRTDVAFWITAQGTFTDPRSRPVGLRPGVAHIAAAAGGGLFIPVAVEYPFWNERLPEAVIAFGPALEPAAGPEAAAEIWLERLEAALAATQDRLAAAAMSRDPRAFTRLHAGNVGVHWAYDLCRRLAAWRRGEHFDPSHGGEAEK
jgi:1-acyl-sn-glycerol-3-phosphate acyltransferase